MENNFQIHSRIAPTPSGYLHLGNVFNFLLTYLVVKKHNGVIGLRIDDIDATRRRDEYVEDIFRVLDWLGLEYEHGPSGPDDFYKHHSQQLRLAIYEEALADLWEKDVLFTCRCSRSQIKAKSTDGQYPKTCRELNIEAMAENVAWRMLTPEYQKISWKDLSGKDYEYELYQEMRDFVIRRKDRFPAYQLVSVIDDIEHEVNFIVRGEDLAASTAAQLFIASHIPSSSFDQISFLHHPLLKDENQQKLSKSAGAISMKFWMEKWRNPVECYRWMGNALGIEANEITSLEDLIALFDPQKLKMTPFLP